MIYIANNLFSNDKKNLIINANYFSNLKVNILKSGLNPINLNEKK